VVAAGRHLSKLFEGWIVVPFEWNATPAEVTERVRNAMDD